RRRKSRPDGQNRRAIGSAGRPCRRPRCRSSPNIGEQALQSRRLHIATGEPAIVIAGSRRCPALVLLAADVGLAGFALSRERVEFLVEPLLGGFAGVDRATPAARVSPRHRCPLWLNVVPARTRERRSGSASTRRRAVPTTPCRGSFSPGREASGSWCPARRSRHRAPAHHRLCPAILA